MTNTTNPRPPSRLIRPENISVPHTGIRVDRLEERIARLEKEFALRFDDYGLNGLPEEIWPPRNKRGPKEKLALEDLLYRRDYFIRVLERDWPELRLVFKRCKNIEQLRKGLGPFIDESRSTDWAKQLSEQADRVFTFVKSLDCRERPRNLANAIAGSPELGLHRSFKLCRDNPSRLPIGDRAIRDHLRLRHPNIFPKLVRAKTEEAAAKIMRSNNTNDPIYLDLRNHPAQVLEAMREGIPRGVD